MEIPKEAILNLLRERGQETEANEADRELPDTVDTDRDGDLLSRFGLDPQELMGKLGDIPGLKGKIPGF